MKIVRAEKIYDKGKYHAWTDLAFWKGNYYLTFTTGTMHTSADGYAEVLRSQDTVTWQHCAKGIFSYGDETAAAGFLVTPDKLFLYLECSRFDLKSCSNHTQSLVCCTENGAWWSNPRHALPENYYIWRPRSFGDSHYMTGYSFDVESWKFGSVLFKSNDGLKWEEVSSPGKIDPRSNETAIEFTKDGKMIALIRCEGDKQSPKDNPKCSYIGRSKPPYKEWKYTKTSFVGGPHLRWWNGELIAIGRTHLKPEEKIAPWDTGDRTAVFKVVNNELKRELLLPGGGDSSYAGSVVLKNGNLLVSYYSSQEFASDPETRLVRNAIYLAELEK